VTPSVMPPRAGQIIDTTPAWLKILPRLQRQRMLALDLEGNGFFRYPEKVCLIQIKSGEEIFLLDPLAVRSLTPLGQILNDPHWEKIFHSCDWDLRALDRDFGFRVRHIFDTSLAAKFLGSNQTGLGNVLQDTLNVTLNKTKKLQRQDWTLRPLSAESLQYAADDVRYLPKLQAVLRQRLQDLGRLEWVEEECRRLENLRYAAPRPPQEAFWNLKGTFSLNDRQRAVLRELFLFREALALEMNRPPFKIMPEKTLLELASNPAKAMENPKSLSGVFASGHERGLREAIQRGLKKPPLPRLKTESPVFRRIVADGKRILKSLKTWRQEKGKALGLDPALIWPLKSLEIMAQTPDSAQDQLLTPSQGEVRNWQIRNFGEELLRRVREEKAAG